MSRISKLSINDAEYGEILKQAINQIHVALTAIAKQVTVRPIRFIGIWGSCFLKNSLKKVMALV